MNSGANIPSHQSLYSMSVLPSQASLASFFVVLVFVLLLTISLGLSLWRLLATFSRIQRRASDKLYNLLRSTNKGRTKDYTEDIASLHLELSHDGTPSIGDYYRAIVDIILETSCRLLRPTMNLPMIQHRPLIKKAFDALISFPSQELSYGFRLFVPVTVPFYVEKRFSYGKLVTDILRILFLPLWIVLGSLLLLLAIVLYIGSCLLRCFCYCFSRTA